MILYSTYDANNVTNPMFIRVFWVVEHLERYLKKHPNVKYVTFTFNLTEDEKDRFYSDNYKYSQKKEKLIMKKWVIGHYNEIGLIDVKLTSNSREYVAVDDNPPVTRKYETFSKDYVFEHKEDCINKFKDIIINKQNKHKEEIAILQNNLDIFLEKWSA